MTQRLGDSWGWRLDNLTRLCGCLLQVGPYVVTNGSTHSSRDSLSAIEQISWHVDRLQQWVQTELRLINTRGSRQQNTIPAKRQASRKLQSKAGLCIQHRTHVCTHVRRSNSCSNSQRCMQRLMQPIMQLLVEQLVQSLMQHLVQQLIQWRVQRLMQRLMKQCLHSGSKQSHSGCPTKLTNDSCWQLEKVIANILFSECSNR